MTVSEAAEIAGISPAYMRSMAANGTVKADKVETVGGLYMWDIPREEAQRIRDNPLKSRGIKRRSSGRKSHRK